MRRGPVARAGGLAVLAGLLAIEIAPRALPAGGPLVDPGTRALATAAFGLQALAAGLAGYVAVVLIALAAASMRSVPATLRVRLHRWTSRGLAGVVRRAIGLSVVVSAALPTTLAAAQAPPAHPPVLAPVDLPAPAPAPIPPAPPPRPPSSATHTLTRGESFWSVAADRVAARLGRAPSDVETAEYWLGLIEANRTILVDPDDPDLLFPGQVLRLP